MPSHHLWARPFFLTWFTSAALDGEKIADEIKKKTDRGLGAPHTGINLASDIVVLGLANKLGLS